MKKALDDCIESNDLELTHSGKTIKSQKYSIQEEKGNDDISGPTAVSKMTFKSVSELQPRLRETRHRLPYLTEIETPKIKCAAEVFLLAVKTAEVPFSALGRVVSDLTLLLQSDLRKAHESLHGKGSFKRRFSSDGPGDTEIDEPVYPDTLSPSSRHVNGDGFEIFVTNGLRNFEAGERSTTPRVTVKFESNFSERSMDRKLLVVQKVTRFVHSLLHMRFKFNVHDRDDADVRVYNYLSDAIISFGLVTQ